MFTRISKGHRHSQFFFRFKNICRVTHPLWPYCALSTLECLRLITIESLFHTGHLYINCLSKDSWGSQRVKLFLSQVPSLLTMWSISVVHFNHALTTFHPNNSFYPHASIGRLTMDLFRSMQPIEFKMVPFH